MDVGYLYGSVWESLVPRIPGPKILVSDGDFPSLEDVAHIRRKLSRENLVEEISFWAVKEWALLNRLPGYHFFRSNALRMLDRDDPAGTFRNLDRQAFFESYCMQTLTVLNDQAVSAFISDVEPHEFVSYVWSRLCKHIGIPTLTFQPCGIAPGVLPRLDGELLGSSDGYEAAPGLPKSFVRQYVGKFFSIAETSKSTQWVQNQQKSDSRSERLVILPRKLGMLLRSDDKALAQSELDFSAVSGRVRARLSIARNLLAYSAKRHLRAELKKNASQIKPVSEHFAVFALHYEPERTTLPEGGDFVDQLRAIAEARKLLPPDVHLYVKEHFSQVSGALRGHMGRSALTYPLINMLPNTSLIDASLPLIEIVERAECVFTITGSVAIEAASLGTPVVYFGRPWWEGLPGTVRFSTSVSWNDVLAGASLSPGVIRDFLTRRLAQNLVPGLAGETFTASVERWGSLPPNLLELQELALEPLLERLLKRPLREKA